MKQQLIALSLIASSGLIAQEGMQNGNQTRNENGYCSTCCCAPCCCKPCCVPKPKKCIDCECYSPQFYDLQCDWGFSVDAAFLYWYAGETNLSYAMKLELKETTVAVGPKVYSPNRYKYVGTAWDPGFRVGIGWNDSCDGWDSNINWTWMKNSKKSSTSVPEFSVLEEVNVFALLNPWINQSFNIPSAHHAQLWDKVSAKWRFTFNQVDWDIGRKYWTSQCFNIRPFAALRGAWWKTRYNLTSTRTGFTSDDGTLVIDYLFKDKFTNKSWGVGFLGGLQPTWYFCCNFALYSSFDVALLWGDFDAKKKEKYTDVQTEVLDPQEVTNGLYNNPSKGAFSQMTPMLDAAIGLRWEESWCCDQYRTALDLGWEHHVLFNTNHRVKTYDAVSDSGKGISFFRTYDEATGNTGMGGFVLRLSFDF